MVKTTTLPQASGIYIQRAKWNDATGKLMVVGRGPKNAAVDIRDASSGAVLTTVMAGDAGRFPRLLPAAADTLRAAGRLEWAAQRKNPDHGSTD